MGEFDLDNLLNSLGIKKGEEETEAASLAEEDNASSTSSDDTAPTTSIATEAPGDDGLTDPASTISAAEPTPASTDASETSGDASTTDEPQSESGSAESSEADEETSRRREERETIFRSLLDHSDPGLRPIWVPNTIAPITDAEKAIGERLGQLLFEKQIIDAQQLENSRRVARQSPGKTFRSILVEMGVAEDEVQRVIAESKGLPFERVNAEDGYDAEFVHKLSMDFCQAHHVLPLRTEDRTVVMGVAYPDDVFLLEDIRRRFSGRPLRQVVVTASDINMVGELLAGDAEEDFEVGELLAEVGDDDVEVVEDNDDDVDFEKQAGESPVIRFVNFMIQSAIKEGASDIHIEPGEKKLKVRFRIDGILYEQVNPPHKMHAAIISRLKIMANLDISERRLPQDGRIRAVVAGRKLDLRVSTLPTVAGEKCVIRILDDRSINIGLEQLGFSENTLQLWQGQIAQPHGIILVTGPTGSGKTTSLYSSLAQMDTQVLNVSTVEDPVEYHLDGINQIQTHDKIGMSFSAALRSLLRQDPDVVMVGEIRDGETAKIAVQAALTGHLVLSTLHTNDAPGSVTRLINIGVEPFLIGAALNAVMAQRLVRRICSNCKEGHEATEEEREFLSLQGLSADQLFKGTGCEKCRQAGYSGRLGIYELLILDDVTRDAIARNPSVTEFRRMCIERGMLTLRQDGMLKVVDGNTTIEEILRVTQSTI